MAIKNFNLMEDIFSKIILDSEKDERLIQLMEKNEYANEAFKEMVPLLFAYYMEGLSSRLAKCETIEEEISLIKEELIEIRETINLLKESKKATAVTWYKGYKLEARKLQLEVDYPLKDGDIGEICSGAAYYRIETQLQQSLDDLTEELKSLKVKGKNSIQWNNQYEIVLFFEFSGLLAVLEDKIGTVKSNLAVAIGTLTGEPAASIRPLLSKVRLSYDHKNARRVYTRENVETVLNALREAGFDASRLMDIYGKIIKKGPGKESGRKNS